MEKIRVAVIDDHPLIREGVTELASDWEDVEVVATGDNAKDALTIAGSALPDVMLLDYRLGSATSVGACRSITRRFPDIKVVAFTVYEDPAVVVEMMRAGAVGFVLKDAEAARIHRAIRSAAKGQSPLDPRVTATVVETANKPAGTGSDAAMLDARDERLLGMVAAGLSNREIADHLFVSEKTVKNSLTRLYKKLGVSRRGEAAALGVKYGYHRLIDDSPD